MTRISPRLLVCALVAASAATALLQSQSLELKPGYISGTVTIGGATINNLQINASSGSLSASSSHTTGSYTTLVNVPAGTTPTYTVRAIVQSDALVDYLQLPTKTVSVTEGLTSLLDFVDPPAYMSGTVTTPPGTFQSAFVYASDASGKWYAQSNTNPSRNAQFTFPVGTGTVRAGGTVYFTNNTSVTIPEQTIGTVAAGGTLTFNMTASPPPTDGSISGTLTISGPETPSQRRVILSGPVFRTATPQTSGAYQFTGLPSGTYNTYLEIYYDQNLTYFQSPYNAAATGAPPITIAGNAVTRDFDVKQAFISGSFVLTGTRTLAHAWYGRVAASGQSGTVTSSGYAEDRLSLPSGDFKLVVSPGTWQMSNYNLVQFSQPAPNYLSGYLYIYDYQNAALPISVGENDTATRNLTYETGTMKVFLRSSGITFGSPRVDVSCSDVVNGQTRTFTSGGFSGNAVNVNIAPVTIVGIKGRCTAWAYGRPTGSSSDILFGQVTLDIVPGSDLTLDIGGPTLSIQAPTANTAFTSGPITVTGKATDDVQVASVVVNGQAATLTSTNNPSDPREMSFTVSIPLVQGANAISTIATDNEGKTATDSRNVYLDAQDPAVTWTPAAGTTYPTPGNVTISGTATDNLGISTITVNGATVYTGGSPPQTTVTFSRVINLSGGTHDLTVVVRDLGNRTVSETRTVTVIAPESQTTIATSPNPSVSGQTVTLTATVQAAGGATGTPTGLVQFKVDNTNFGGQVLLSGGQASLTTSTLAIGSRAVTASYTGSFIFLPSSAATTHVVNKVGTTTTVTSNLNPSTYNNSVTFTATVSAVAPGTGTPSGTLQFKANGANIGGPASFAGGSVSRSFNNLTAGSHSIEAVYAGNSTFDASTSPSLAQTVNQATPTVTWSNPAAITYGTLLSGSQLNAFGSVAGTMTYNPPAGTRLDAGTHTLNVTFTPSDAVSYTQKTASVTITVNKLTPSITVTGGSHVYDGNPHPATATVTGVGGQSLGPVAIAYSPGGSNAPADVGTYAVTATFDGDANYTSRTGTATISITKATATLTLANLTHVFDGSAKAATVSTNPGSLTGTSLTYGGSPSPPSEPGNYSVVATLNHDNYTASAVSNTLAIAKVTPQLTLSGGTFTYDNLPHPASSALTGFDGQALPLTVTYNGSPTPPVNAGVYSVQASFAGDAHHLAAGGSTTVTITKASASLVANTLAHTYSGSAKAATVTSSPAGLSGIAVTYDGSTTPPINAGTYTVQASLTNQNYDATLITVTMVIAKALPAIDWAQPATIVCLTTLTDTQLNASSSVPGSFSYTPALGATLGAGTHTLTGMFTPGDSTNYEAASATVSLTVLKASPTIDWAQPPAMTYGAALSATQLNATASVPGQLTYQPALGTALGAGNHALNVTFTPADTDNYSGATATVTLEVKKATPEVSTSGGTFVYNGSARPSTATSNVGGTFSYQYEPGGSTAPANAAATPYTVVATFTPSDTTNYDGATATNTITITKAASPITWSPPASITYGAALGAAQLNATAGTSGTFTYAPPSATQLGAGTHTLEVTFTPNDVVNYEPATSSVSLTVMKATPVVSTSGGSFVYDGTSHGSTGTASVPGSFSYAYTPGGSSAPVNASAMPYSVAATFAPNDSANYNNATATNTIAIAKAASVITWAPPAPLAFGTPLSSAQLNATANVAGEFAYSPGMGAQLSADNHTLSTSFTPADSVNYLGATKQVALGVVHNWTGVLQPINQDGTSVFKFNSTVPVKFQLTGGSAGSVLTARIYVAKMSNGVAGIEAEAVSTAQADAGNVFRYDPTTAQYIFNLGTKGMSEGTWQIRVDLGDKVTRTVIISLRK